MCLGVSKHATAYFALVCLIFKNVRQVSAFECIYRHLLFDYKKAKELKRPLYHSSHYSNVFHLSTPSAVTIINNVHSSISHAGIS